MDTKDRVLTVLGVLALVACVAMILVTIWVDGLVRWKPAISAALWLFVGAVCLGNAEQD